MIIGLYEGDDAVVLPLDRMAQHCGISEYSIKQALEGKARFPGKTFVKLPPNAVFREPKGRKTK